MRCESLEKNAQQLVYTIDTGHAASLAVAGHHIQHDFTTAGVLEEMDRIWPGLVFHYIILDYFNTPNSWHKLHFLKTIYTEILPILAAEGAIPIGKEEGLPRIPCIEDRLNRLWDFLAPWFSRHSIPDPSLNPLYRATVLVENDILASGDRFTNGSALISLDQESPFIMLRYTSSGDRLAPHQSVACRSLVSELWTAGRRQLRFKLPAHSRPSKDPSTKIRMKKPSAKIRMKPLPSLFHVIATSATESSNPISILDGPPPPSHSIHSTYSPTIEYDTAAPTGTPTGPPTSSTTKACFSQPITVLPSSFYPLAHIAPSRTQPFVSSAKDTTHRTQHQPSAPTGPPTESTTSLTLSTRSLKSPFNSE
jgi:hypothetical protein